jgi:hypothetical protein
MSPGRLQEELRKSRASVSHGAASFFCCSATDSESSRSRHQLNHTPKQIYKCDFPDCVRTFVRQDLCNRHRNRHRYQSPQETNPNSYSPATNSSSRTCSRTGLLEPSYPTSMSTGHPSESIHHQQSGPDMILLDEMLVFGGEGYNQCPFAIPENFVVRQIFGWYLQGGQCCLSKQDCSVSLGPHGNACRYCGLPDSRSG